MSSATSTEERSLHSAARASQSGADGLRPWQFFLLAGMLAATGVVLVVSGQTPASLIVLSLVVVSASLVGYGAYCAFAPLVSREGAQGPQLIVGRTRAALEREKTLALRAIKELEFDYAMKKMAKSDYEQLSAALRARALRLMRQLDEGGGYREAIEREIRARLGTQANAATSAAQHQPASPAPPLDEPATAAAPPDTSTHEPCSCGTINDPDARFCKNCGSRLVAA